MSFHYSPKIVTDNLIFYLDGANYHSYVSGSTKWYDISKREHVTTLFNSPTFSNSNMGCIVFDGINNYGTFPYIGTTLDFKFSNTDFTLEAWFNSSDFSGGQVIISNDTYGWSFDYCIYIPNNQQITILTQGTLQNVTVNVPTMSPNTWYHCVISSVNGGSTTIYLNGIDYGSGSITISDNFIQPYLTIGCAAWNNPNSFFKGKLGIVKMYRKALTQNEVTQNYNTLKPRFS